MPMRRAGRRRTGAGSAACSSGRGRRARAARRRSRRCSARGTRPCTTRRLADDVVDAHARIERGKRILEDHLHRRACCRAAVASSVVQSRAAKAPRPALGACRPATMRPSVDLPQPDSPTRPTTSPSCDGERRRRRPRARHCLAHVGAERARSCRPTSSGLTKRLETLRKLERGASWRSAVMLGRQREEAAHLAAVGSARSGIAHAGARVRGAARRGTRSPAAGRSSDGVMPGICAQRLARRVARRAPSRAGRACTDERRVEHVVGRALLDDASGIHHADAVGEPGDDREVVRDPDQRACRTRGTASASRTGSGPGW